MLNRSNKSERIIQKNEQICVQLQTEINHLQEKLVKLDELFKMKKKNFSTVNPFVHRRYFQSINFHFRQWKIVEKKKN